MKGNSVMMHLSNNIGSAAIHYHKKNSAFPASHCQKPHTFPAFPYVLPKMPSFLAFPALPGTLQYVIVQ